MRRGTFFVVLFTACFAAGPASAQCAFRPGNSGKLEVPMLRAFAGCDSPNTTTEGGVPACSPVQPANTASTGFGFGRLGRCKLQASPEIVKNCSQLENSEGEPLGLPARGCHLTKVRVQCHDVLVDGVPVEASDGNWLLRTVTSVTFDDPVAGDVTQVDYPVSFEFDPARGGSLRLQTSTADALVPLLGTAGAALPPCTHLRPVEVGILDPNAEVFAKVGLATRR